MIQCQTSSKRFRHMLFLYFITKFDDKFTCQSLKIPPPSITTRSNFEIKLNAISLLFLSVEILGLP